MIKFSLKKLLEDVNARKPISRLNSNGKAKQVVIRGKENMREKRYSFFLLGLLGSGLI